MDNFFCKDKKDFCSGKHSCLKCSFARGKGTISGHIAHDLLSSLFGPDYDLDRLKVLYESDKKGLVIVVRQISKCGSCSHYLSEPDRNSAVCEVRLRRGTPLTRVARSKKSCKFYSPLSGDDSK